MACGWLMWCWCRPALSRSPPAVKSAAPRAPNVTARTNSPDWTPPYDALSKRPKLISPLGSAGPRRPQGLTPQGEYVDGSKRIFHTHCAGGTGPATAGCARVHVHRLRGRPRRVFSKLDVV